MVGERRGFTNQDKTLNEPWALLTNLQKASGSCLPCPPPWPCALPPLLCAFSKVEGLWPRAEVSFLSGTERSLEGGCVCCERCNVLNPEHAEHDLIYDFPSFSNLYTKGWTNGWYWRYTYYIIFMGFPSCLEMSHEVKKSPPKGKAVCFPSDWKMYVSHAKEQV